ECAGVHDEPRRRPRRRPALQGRARRSRRPRSGDVPRLRGCSAARAAARDAGAAGRGYPFLLGAVLEARPDRERGGLRDAVPAGRPRRAQVVTASSRLGTVQMMRWLTGVLAATALVAAGCGGTTAQIGAGASDIVPASAPAFVAVDTDSNSAQWQAINALAGKFPDKQKGVDSIKQDLHKQAKLDWAKDVKPAFGKELDVAWLDFENNGRNFVVLTQPRDETKFKQLIAKGNAAETDSANRVVTDRFRGWEVVSP